MGIWACGTIRSKMACVILQSLTTQADRMLSHFDNPQIGVMTWACALLEEVSLSDTMQRMLHADVIAILCPHISESPAAKMAVGAHKENTPELHYILDWEIEYECQTNVITPHPTWELDVYC